MRIQLFFILVQLIASAGCDSSRHMYDLDHTKVQVCTSSAGNDTSKQTAEQTYRTTRGALLGTRFNSLEELKKVVNISYNHPDSATMVCVRHCSNGMEVVSVLKTGISQGDIRDARDGNLWGRIRLLIGSPYTVINRADLERAYLLARWMPLWFGEGDIAFYDIAKASVGNINTDSLAFSQRRDSTEKGYLNSFNHILQQAFVTSCFSEEMADFIADAHERFLHPEIISGKFSSDQINDLEEGPVDNYVDLINNEWGQELGKQLREKYNINREMNWTPELLARYLNDIQSYFSWAFQIGFKPFRADHEMVIRFADKINFLMKRDGKAVIGASGGVKSRRLLPLF